MNITRFDQDARMSEAVVHGDTIYLAGQIAAPGEDITTQTQAVLEEIEALLERASSSKNHMLMATIWLADMADFGAMNAVWDAWVADITPPARATGEVKLASPQYKIEIIVVAAKA